MFCTHRYDGDSGSVAEYAHPSHNAKKMIRIELDCAYIVRICVSVCDCVHLLHEHNGARRQLARVSNKKKREERKREKNITQMPSSS